MNPLRLLISANVFPLSQVFGASGPVFPSLSWNGLRHCLFRICLCSIVVTSLGSVTCFGRKIDGNKLLAPNHVVEIKITLPGADWDKLRLQSRNMGAMFSGGSLDSPFEYYRADVSIDGVEVKSVGVRKKGLFGSADVNRTSLKIKFDEFQEQDPIKGLSRLTLNNNKQDTSQISQFLTYRLFRDAGVAAPRSNFARVTVNDVYLGVYSNVESVKKSYLKRSFKDSSGNLYEGTLTDFHPKTIDKLEAKTNSKDNDRSVITKLAMLLDTEGDIDVSAVGEIVDLDNFMTFWATEGLVRFWDGYSANQNNFFFYQNPTNGRGYFMPWGADGSFSKNGGPFARFGATGPTSIYAQSLLANRLYHSPGMPERYRTEMLRLLKEVWNEDKLIAEIDRVEKLLKPHLADSQSGTGEAMNDVRDFINGRREVVEKELADWPATVPNEPRKPMYAVTVGTLTGSFTADWQERPQPDPESVGKADLRYIIDNKRIELKPTGATVQTFQMPRFGPGSFGAGGPGRRPGAGNGNSRQTPPAPISLILAGTRTDNNQRVNVSLFVDRDLFDNQKNTPIEVTGRISEGQNRGFGFGGPGNKSVNGTIQLTKSDTSDRGQSLGSVDLKIVEVHGGMFNQRPRGRRPGPPGQLRSPSRQRPPAEPSAERQ